MNYTYCYISEIDSSTLCYDLFFSAYDGCQRTSTVFDNVRANVSKQWLVFPQYQVMPDKLPAGCFVCDELKEDDYITAFIDSIRPQLTEDCKICLDSTGFLIPHLIYLIGYLSRMGIKKFDVIYSEPNIYLDAENTEFSKNIQNPEPICGFSASPSVIGGDEILIVSSGYNDELINIVARDKDKSKSKIFITGFPSLQADMYQQNLIQLNKCKETIGSKGVEYIKAPAYDPFSTAQKIQDSIDKIYEGNPNISFVHLAPLSTKPQAIAMALVYLNNPSRPINILYPRSNTHHLGHADGINRTWVYSLELS